MIGCGIVGIEAAKVAGESAKNDAVQSRCWKNLLFMKDGRSVLGYPVFDREQDALDGVRLAENEMRESLAKGRDVQIISNIDHRKLYLFSEYRSAIQVPWGNEP